MNQIGMQTGEHPIRSIWSQEWTQVESAFEHPNAFSEADPIRVQSLGIGGLERESPHRIVSQQEGIEFLQTRTGNLLLKG